MPTKPKYHKPLSPKTQAAVDEWTTKLADVLLAVTVAIAYPATPNFQVGSRRWFSRMFATHT